MTVAPLQMTGKRRQTSQQPQTQLPAIAPKHKTPSAPSLGRRGSLTVNPVATLPKPRLPPRSRFGCWYARGSLLSEFHADNCRGFRTCRVCFSLHLVFGVIGLLIKRRIARSSQFLKNCLNDDDFPLTHVTPDAMRLDRGVV